MKKLFSITLILTLVTAFMSCTKEVPVQDPQLEPNLVNVHGLWKTVELDGIPFPEGAEVYMDFSRKDKSYKEYRRNDTMYPILKTGYFNIRHELEGDYIISGSYYQSGDWDYDYAITSLTADEMVWKRTSDGEIQKLLRCDKLPDEFGDVRE